MSGCQGVDEEKQAMIIAELVSMRVNPAMLSVVRTTGGDVRRPCFPTPLPAATAGQPLSIGARRVMPCSNFMYPSE